jgi:hypothetical protein
MLHLYFYYYSSVKQLSGGKEKDFACLIQAISLEEQL